MCYNAKPRSLHDLPSQSRSPICGFYPWAWAWVTSKAKFSDCRGSDPTHGYKTQFQGTRLWRLSLRRPWGKPGISISNQHLWCRSKQLIPCGVCPFVLRCSLSIRPPLSRRNTRRVPHQLKIKKHPGRCVMAAKSPTALSSTLPGLWELGRTVRLLQRGQLSARKVGPVVLSGRWARKQSVASGKALSSVVGAESS